MDSIGFCFDALNPRLTKEIVVETFAQAGFTVLNLDQVKGSDTVLDARCKNGHLRRISYHDVKHALRHNNPGCPECSGNSPCTRAKIIAAFEDKGEQVLDCEDNPGSKTKVKAQCSAGHVYFSCYGNLIAGHGCPKCAGRAKVTKEDVYATFAKVGAVILDPTPLDKDIAHSMTKVKVQCSQGHEGYLSNTYALEAIKNGTNGCAKCGGVAHASLQDVFDLFDKLGATVLNPQDFVNNKSKLQVRCTEGHVYTTAYNTSMAALRRGKRGCLACFNSRPHKVREHGTYNKYISEHCRCTLCKAAMAEHGKQYRESRR